MNKITESILLPSQKRMLSHKEFCDYYGIGLTTAKKLGREIGCIHRVGKRILFDRVIADKYFTQEIEHEK